MRWEGFQLALLLVCATLLSSACLSAASVPEGVESASRSDKASPVDSTAPLATLVGFEQSASGVRIQVISTGCTRSEDFELVVDQVEDGRVQLTVLRTRPDDCRRMPAAKTIEFTRDSIGLADEEIILVNPLVALPGRG